MLNLYNKDYTTKYGTINSVIEAFVEEERNGLFELSFIMLNTDSLFNYIKEDNIVVANANNTLVNQKFRIYMTRKLMNNRVEVFARHISFDLMYDYIDNISFENQSCEYALNQLFRSSQFSKHYKGYSNIVNAQNYSMSMANVLEAIGGKEGSLLDTFGTGAELLRDNENIHILNKRGHDNSVSIEYKKNLTGFELEEDNTDLVTRVLPYARYTPEGGEEVIVKASFVDSPLIANYSHPFVKAIDYTDKFEEGEEVTTSKLITFAQNEYKVNKVDIPKQNFKIEFIPLSKCVGYEGLEDNISLCDTVTIKDTRYDINTQAKVIKTTFNVLKNRYESMELGEPKTSLGDIIGSGNNEDVKGEQGPPGPQGPPGADGNIGDFPNSLPSTPIVTTKVYGFANIEISWTFENKVYYQYEVYASKEANFTPNTFNLIHSGQTSTYMYQAKPDEAWHFKVCCVNSHGERTNFGYAYATTTKVDDLSNYVDEMAINEALIGTLSLDRGWVGELKGNYIDARNLSVTDSNGKRTLDIDSYGNIYMYPTQLKVLAENTEIDVGNEIAWQSKELARIDIKADSITSMVKNDYYNKAYVDNELAWLGSESSRIEQKANNISLEVSKKVGVDEVKSTIRQDFESVNIGFNGIDERIKMTTDGMFFKDINNKTTLSFKRGYMHLYNPADNTLMGGYMARNTVGGEYYDNGVSNIVSSNGYFYSIGLASDWSNDNQTTFTPSELFVLNFRSRGEDISKQMGGHFHTPLYAHDGINCGGGNISNINTATALTVSATEYRHPNGLKLFSSDGWVVNNNVGWDWKHQNLLDPVIIGGSYGYSVVNNTKEVPISNLNCKTDTLSEIEIVNTLTKDNAKTLDVSNVTNKEEIMLDENNVDLSKLVTLLISEVKKLKNEIEILKNK